MPRFDSELQHLSSHRAKRIAHCVHKRNMPCHTHDATAGSERSAAHRCINTFPAKPVFSRIPLGATKKFPLVPRRRGMLAMKLFCTNVGVEKLFPEENGGGSLLKKQLSRILDGMAVSILTGRAGYRLDIDLVKRY